MVWTIRPSEVAAVSPFLIFFPPHLSHSTGAVPFLKRLDRSLNLLTLFHPHLFFILLGELLAPIEVPDYHTGHRKKRLHETLALS